MKTKILKLIEEAKLKYNLCFEVNIDDNIIIPATSEEEHYYVKYENKWYSINIDTDLFKEDDFGGEYYDEYYAENELFNELKDNKYETYSATKI
jgi:hypothetical protein